MEKVGLLATLNTHERVTWSGAHRPPLFDAEIAPRPAKATLPVWIGAGSPNSVVRAATLRYPLAIPILGRTVTGYAQNGALDRHAWATADRDPADVRIASFGHLHVTEPSRQTHQDFFPYYSAYLEPLFRGPMPRRSFEQMVAPGGSLVGGRWTRSWTNWRPCGT